MNGCSVVFATNGTPVLDWSVGGWMFEGTHPEVWYFVLRDGKKSLKLSAHTHMDSGWLR